MTLPLVSCGRICADQKQQPTATDQLLLVKKIRSLPLLNAEDEIVPRELQKNKHVKERRWPQRVPDPRMWDSEEEARKELSQSPSPEPPVDPDNWDLDPPAVREIREARWKLVADRAKLSDAECAQVWKEIAKEVLTVMGCAK